MKAVHTEEPVVVDPAVNKIVDVEVPRDNSQIVEENGQNSRNSGNSRRNENDIENAETRVQNQVNAVVVTPVVQNVTQNAVKVVKPVKDFEEYDISEAWAVCLVTGMVGGHWFYLHKPAKGLLYFCTLGFMGLGYVVDLLRLPLLVQRKRIAVRCKREGKPYLFEPGFVEAYWVGLISGIIGGHHFYLRNYGMGFLYFCTLGFLGLGYLYDLFFMVNLVKRSRFEINTAFVDKYGIEAWQQAREMNKEEAQKIGNKFSLFFKKKMEEEQVLVAEEVQVIEEYQGKGNEANTV